MNKSKRSGIGAFLGSIRLIFGNPVSRILLRLVTLDSVCRYNGRRVNAPIVYHALSIYADEELVCSISVRFLSIILNTVISLGVKALGGSTEDLANALKDPALRRGVSLVLKGLGLYGVTVPQKLPAPFMIVWNFTNMCNLRCIHCYQRADKPLPNELSLEEKLRIVDELDKAGVAAIALSGGEPTIHPHYYRVLKEIGERGMYAATATNGWIFADASKLEKAVNYGLRYVEVSIDSSKPEKHDYFRGVRGSWEKAVKALRNAVDMGLNHAMAVTITRFNIDEVDGILDLAESIGVKRVVFFNFIPVGRGEDNIWLDLDPLTREKFLRKLYREMKKRSLEIISTAPQYGRIALQLSSGKEVSSAHFYVGGDPVVKALTEFIGGCGAGRIYAGLQPDGTLIPCVFMPIPLGSLREKSFWEIWENSPILKTLRDRGKLLGFCDKCPYKNICGGCRARAYSYFGDIRAPDPGCIYNLKYWRLVEEKTKAKSHTISATF
ncbi:MAG: radical SAM protein [Thermoprotei archaeon]